MVDLASLCFAFLARRTNKSNFSITFKLFLIMKKLLYFSLYFSEGAPIGFIWWALPSILTKQGVSTSEIATLAAIATIPWTFKFLLAPMVDLISMNVLKLKKQLMIYQISMGISLMYVSSAIENQNLSILTMTIIVHGFFAALQDICIDALAIRNIPKDELGNMNGVMQAGVLVGRSIFGGAGVYIAYLFGLNIMIYLLISSIWISLFILQRSNIGDSNPKSISIKAYLIDFFNLATNKKFWTLIGVAYFAGYSFNGISTIAGSVLTQSGASDFLYGLVYSLFLPITMCAGALLGGNLSDKLSSSVVLKFTLVFSIISSVFVGYIMDNFSTPVTLILSYIVFYFFIGSTTSSLYGFLMKHTSKEFAALEFSIFMGVVNFCESSTSYLTGQSILYYSYTSTSIFIGLVCLISIMILTWFEKKEAL